MLQSASILPLTEQMLWGRAKPLASSEALTAVNPANPIEVANYRRRDQELAFRDLVVAAFVSKVALKFGEIWQFNQLRPYMPAAIDTPLGAVAADTPAPLSPAGSVPHVKNSSVPYDGVTTDRWLYGRDLTLYQALRTICATAELADMVPNLATVAPSDAWSLAEGASRALSGVGFNVPLGVDLLKDPDRDLADRDNQNAVFVSQLQEAVSDLFARATKLYVASPGSEPETYVLVSDTASERIWVAFPQLPSRYRVTYAKATRTVTWLGEIPFAANPEPPSFAVPVAGGYLDAVATVPPKPDIEFYRQKAARLHTRSSVDRVLFQTTVPELYVLSGGVYQPDAVLMTVPQATTYCLPLFIPAGACRVSVAFVLSEYFSLLGFMNRDRAYDGTAVTTAANQTLYYDVQLPAGRSRLSFTLTDKTAETPSFACNITCSYPANGGVRTSLAFDGAFIFNTAPGTPVTTQEFEINTTGGLTTIGFTWLGGAGQLTVERLNFGLPVESGSPQLNLQVQLGALNVSPVQLQAALERPDVCLFDVLIPDDVAVPQLGISWSGGGGGCLYIRAYDVRTFDVEDLVPDPPAFDPHKSSLAFQALGCAQDAFDTALAAGTLSPPPAKTADGQAYVWDWRANSLWVAALQQTEPRIKVGFQTACPGDIGRPALIPASLANGSGIPTISLDLRYARPVFSALQAWMLEFQPLVAGPSFWPVTPGCQSLGPLASFVTSSSYVFGSELVAGTVTRVSSIATATTDGVTTGSDFFAFTIPNAGPGGGAVTQTLTVTAYLTGLIVGVTYQVEATLEKFNVTTGASLGTTTVQGTAFAAAATAAASVIGPVTAGSNERWILRSVALV